MAKGACPDNCNRPASPITYVWACVGMATSSTKPDVEVSNLAGVRVPDWATRNDGADSADHVRVDDAEDPECRPRIGKTQRLGDLVMDDLPGCFCRDR